MKARQDVRLALPAVMLWTIIELPTRWLGWGVLVGVVVLTLAVLMRRRGYGQTSYSVVALVGLTCAIGCTTTLVHGLVEDSDATRKLYGRYVTVKGTVVRHVEPKEGSFTTMIEVNRIHAPGTSMSSSASLRVQSSLDEFATMSRNDEVVVRGTLRETWEGDSAAGIFAVTHLETHQPARGLDGWAVTIRQELIAAGTDGHRALILGVVVGDDSFLDTRIETEMRALGLAHLTAVSGAHVSLVLGGALALIGRRRPLLAGAGSIGALVALVAIVGPEPSVIRASLMGVFLCAAIALRRPASAFPLLCIVIIGVSLMDPDLAGSLGMRLSAVATAAIVLFGYPLTELLSRRMPVTLSSLIAIPLVAGIATGPFLIGIQEVSSIWAVLANALVAPVVAPLTIIGLAGAIALPYAPAPALIALDLASLCTWWIDAVSSTLFALPGSGVTVVQSTLAALVFFALIVAFCISGRFALWTTFALVAMVGTGYVLSCLKSFVSPVIAKGWEVVQCDVGQGSALLARYADDVVLVDVGEEGAGIARCLSDAGVQTVSLLVLTHFDSDHVGGLAELIAAVGVDEVWLSLNHHPMENSERVIELLATEGIPINYPEMGESKRFTSSGLAIELLAPNYVAGYSDSTNADSLVVRISTQTIDTYVLADIPATRQDQLAVSLAHVEGVRSGEPITTPPTGGRRRIAVVVAHHGARDQSERLAAVLSPDVSLISVGENSYGHPHEEALRIWDAPLVARTDECGHISLTSESVVSKCGG